MNEEDVRVSEGKRTVKNRTRKIGISSYIDKKEDNYIGSIEKTIIITND